MPGDTKGADFVSWWTNRRTYREGIAGTVSQLRDIEKRLTAAAGSAAPANAPNSDSIEELKQKADKTLAELAEARGKVPKFDPAIDSERASMQTKVANVEASARQRTRQAAEMAARGHENMARLALKRRQNYRKLAAIVIVLVVLALWIVY